MQRTSDDLEDQRDVGEWVDVTELIERISAERGDPIDVPGRHRLQIGADPRRSRRRRLAPVVAGVATVIVATTVALTLRGGGSPAAPELNAALVGAAAPSSAAVLPPVPSVALAPPVPQSVGADALPVPQTVHLGGTAAPTAVTPVKPATPVATDGVQAAQLNGWTLVDRDEFTTALGAKWGVYDGKGNAGEGRRSPGAITVRGGVATIHGDANGTTGGMAWRDDRRTGRWEMRAKFPKGDAQYHPVLLLWPQSGGSDRGEVDFAETTSASPTVSFFLHHGSGDQETAKKQIDLTQWHNYAVEVTADRVTGYVDGQKWFESTDRDTLPRGPVHPVIQLDWFPKGDSPQPSDLLVDWMRIYE